ncbi:MAG TPA: hypothetical protein VGU01_08870 [Sphingomicrobium sp.]|nr:hypothetical protein [Sphingomicrobium sp.]
MFVKTVSGRYYPIGSVEYFSKNEDGPDGAGEAAMLRDGSTERLCRGEIRRILDAGARPFAAARDTYVLQEVLDENNKRTVERVPVLAWILSPERGVVPITIEGVNHGLDGPAAVLMPNGEVVVAMTCTYANEHCYFAELRSSGEVS